MVQALDISKNIKIEIKLIEVLNLEEIVIGL